MSKNDSRFDQIKYDPRFSMLSKKDRKIKLDNRFREVLTDKKFKIVSKTDKYGRKIETDDNINKELQEFYYHSDQEEEQKNQKKKDLKKVQKNKQIEEEVDDQEVSESGSEEGFQWSQQSSTDSEELDEINDDQQNGPEFHYGVQKEEVPNFTQSSNMLALVNYDWMNIKPSDLMLLFNSFKGPEGVIKRIYLYISEFGKQKLEEENIKGPQNIWKEDYQAEKKQTKKTERQSRRQDVFNQNVVAKACDEECDLDPIKLREYEKQRMRYYYAVIECDSTKTAEKIYEECDGQEFELSNIPIDLRFVPTDTVFPFEPTEVCDEIPADSEVKSIVCKSIGHTNVNLTWDQPINDRFKFIEGKKPKDLAKIDWSKYLAPEVAADEQELFENKDDQIKALEDELLKQEEEIKKLKNEKKQKNQIEIKFNQGFEELSKKIQDKNLRQNENIFQTKERKLKEKQLQRKQKQEDVTLIDNSQMKNKNKDKINHEELKKQKAQLALLVDDEKKEEAEINLSDPRFKAVYENKEYAIDPTNKSFNPKTSSKILQEQIKMRKKRKLQE